MGHLMARPSTLVIFDFPLLALLRPTHAVAQSGSARLRVWTSVEAVLDLARRAVSVKGRSSSTTRSVLRSVVVVFMAWLGPESTLLLVAYVLRVMAHVPHARVPQRPHV